MNSVSVSVIIPCYNCFATIERAVASVTSQTLRPNEIIMVDDASKDQSLTCLKELRDKYGHDWIRIIPLDQNRGPAAARNIAWQEASSNYLAFLDADDAWHPRKIEVQYGWMQHHPNVILSGHKCLWNRDNSIDIPVIDTWHVKAVHPLMLLISNHFLTRSVMLKRKINYQFDERKRHSEDYLLWLQIILDGHCGHFFDAPLAFSYKAPFGEKGLSESLWKMEKGELMTYAALWKRRSISVFTFLFLLNFSILKFSLRCINSLLPRSRWLYSSPPS